MFCIGLVPAITLALRLVEGPHRALPGASSRVVAFDPVVRWGSMLRTAFGMSWDTRPRRGAVSEDLVGLSVCEQRGREERAWRQRSR